MPHGKKPTKLAKFRKTLFDDSNGWKELPQNANELLPNVCLLLHDKNKQIWIYNAIDTNFGQKVPPGHHNLQTASEGYQMVWFEKYSNVSWWWNSAVLDNYLSTISCRWYYSFLVVWQSNWTIPHRSVCERRHRSPVETYQFCCTKLKKHSRIKKYPWFGKLCEIWLNCPSSPAEIEFKFVP